MLCEFCHLPHDNMPKFKFPGLSQECTAVGEPDLSADKCHESLVFFQSCHVHGALPEPISETCTCFESCSDLLCASRSRRGHCVSVARGLAKVSGRWHRLLEAGSRICHACAQGQHRQLCCCLAISSISGLMRVLSQLGGSWGARPESVCAVELLPSHVLVLVVHIVCPNWPALREVPPGQGQAGPLQKVPDAPRGEDRGRSAGLRRCRLRGRGLGVCGEQPAVRKKGCEGGLRGSGWGCAPPFYMVVLARTWADRGRVIPQRLEGERAAHLTMGEACGRAPLTRSFSHAFAGAEGGGSHHQPRLQRKDPSRHTHVVQLRYAA